MNFNSIESDNNKHSLSLYSIPQYYFFVTSCSINECDNISYNTA